MIKLNSMLLLAALLVPAQALAGGWSVVTVQDWPMNPRAGQPVNVRFAVRAHGRTLAGGIDMRVVARHESSGRTVEVRAQEEEFGYYHASLPLEQAGTWSWHVEGYGRHPLPELKVGPAVADTEAGAEDLFVSKGCATCHAYRTLTRGGARVGPDLSHYQAEPAFLEQWLADPQSVRPGAYMPDLELDAAEITTLVRLFSRR